jgi:hypothetical protein
MGGEGAVRERSRERDGGGYAGNRYGNGNGDRGAGGGGGGGGYAGGYNTALSVYVGGLPFDYDDQQLRALFTELGVVTGAKARALQISVGVGLGCGAGVRAFAARAPPSLSWRASPETRAHVGGRRRLPGRLRARWACGSYTATRNPRRQHNGPPLLARLPALTGRSLFRRSS